MCFKKWFYTPPPIEVLPYVKRRLITFGKNLYGGNNDLRGCWNDSLNLSAKSLSMFPDFEVRKFKDNDVTRDRYLCEFYAAVRSLHSGATVLVFADSCFSGSVTRGTAQMNIKHITKNRFYDSGLPPRKKANKFAQPTAGNHILMSGCMENETSSDAYINGSYNGAFTFFAVMALKLGMTYREWYGAIRKFLPSVDLTQTPTIEGPDYLLDRKVFEGETLIIHNSSHGSYIYDKNGDESDGRDETLYFDKHVIDDEISVILQQIPK